MFRIIIITFMLYGCTTSEPTPFKLGVEVAPPMGYGECVEVGICEKN